MPGINFRNLNLEVPFRSSGEKEEDFNKNEYKNIYILDFDLPHLCNCHGPICAFCISSGSCIGPQGNWIICKFVIIILIALFNKASKSLHKMNYFFWHG
jgi:hypothetical protein